MGIPRFQVLIVRGGVCNQHVDGRSPVHPRTGVG